MEAINFRNFIELKKRFSKITDIEKELRKRVNVLIEKLWDKIEKDVEIKNSGWIIDKLVEITNDKSHRGSIFIKKKDVDYKIGIEHFNPNFEEDKNKRDDYMFCGKIKGKEWLEKKYLNSYREIEMKTNSMEYVNLLLTEDIDNLVCHFFEEFKTYFNNNK